MQSRRLLPYQKRPILRLRVILHPLKPLMRLRKRTLLQSNPEQTTAEQEESTAAPEETNTSGADGNAPPETTGASKDESVSDDGADADSSSPDETAQNTAAEEPIANAESAAASWPRTAVTTVTVT